MFKCQSFQLAHYAFTHLWPLKLLVGPVFCIIYLYLINLQGNAQFVMNLNEDNLKSVIALPYTTFNVGGTIKFNLMKRSGGSLIAYPVDADVREDIIFNMSEKDAQHVDSKLLLAKKDDVLSIISRKQGELNKQLEDDGDSSEKCFIEQVIASLREREDMVLGIPDPVNENQIGEALTHLDVNEAKEVDVPVNQDISSTPLSKFHYFYQASDGQHIHIHAINARMLEHTYGSLEFGPRTSTGKILEKEGGSMTEELCKRLRYLQHLPVTCQFEEAEIQLRQPIVTKDTIEHFQAKNMFYPDQIEIRRKRRQRRSKEEKRREKRI
ncbi:hypothetical protein JTB14_025844 [Gonioctena quinquepunctata]|nr:hypothetical protein JTB14_025844 [Gonioctena quinquepunctata]